MYTDGIRERRQIWHICVQCYNLKFNMFFNKILKRVATADEPHYVKSLTLHTTFISLHIACIHCLLTWQSLGPLDGRDDLSATQPVQGSHEAGGGVRQGAVVAGVDGVRLDGLQQGQHRGDKLRHALGYQGAGLNWWRSRHLGRVAQLAAL